MSSRSTSNTLVAFIKIRHIKRKIISIVNTADCTVGPKSPYVFWLLLSNFPRFYGHFTQNPKEIKYPYIVQYQE